jgi:hypothetical protein
MPKINIKIGFTHHKKNRSKYAELSTFFFDEDSSSGPVVERGKSTWLALDARDNDIIEFSTTKWDGEYDIKIFRDGKLVNGADEKPSERLRRKIARRKTK